MSVFDNVVGLNTFVGGMEIDGLFRSNVPGILGDVAAFPLKVCFFLKLINDPHTLVASKLILVLNLFCNE